MGTSTAAATHRDLRVLAGTFSPSLVSCWLLAVKLLAVSSVHDNQYPLFCCPRRLPGLSIYGQIPSRTIHGNELIHHLAHISQWRILLRLRPTGHGRREMCSLHHPPRTMTSSRTRAAAIHPPPFRWFPFYGVLVQEFHNGSFCL